ncbi:hypothetical protein H310_09002 [Aphanomyces invadans]|uniref:Myotubularin phosphatase domain-containing protein n=1 Tax=Aphanomyces invadans TaxID=157072 RepID=A0A024TVV8_9STRA|nr:hypothetical protein H310_09002 [Aphanomyces invadans]ETV98290.1 hypothetical protein H310_09002 [Aphanomyces invadans]|eukprot:XP_008873165.1 hypothetical protein H310_09002 [Aphanomyces invadans]
MTSLKIPSIEDIDEQELMQFDRQSQFDSSTMERLLQAEQSVRKAAQATMDASNMMNFNSKASASSLIKSTSSAGTGFDEASASSYASYCVPELVPPSTDKSTPVLTSAGTPVAPTAPLPRLKYPTPAHGYNMSFEIPRSEDGSTARAASCAITSDQIDGDGPPVVRKMPSQPIFGVKGSSSGSLNGSSSVANGLPPPVPGAALSKGSDSIYTFTVKKADNILDQMSKKSTVLVQIDTHRRMLCFLTPTNPTEKEEFSCAAVNAKPYQKFGLHLRIEKGGQAPVMNRKITFFGADDRDRFMEALEQGKVMYKTPKKLVVNGSHHGFSASHMAGNESSDSFEDLDQWLMECSHTSFPVQDPDLELTLLEGEHVVEHVQRVTNMVVISQKERAVQGVMKITNYRIAFMPYDTSARYGSFEVPLAALLPISREGLKLNLPCKDLRKICLAMHDAYTHKNYYDAPPQTPDVRWIQMLMTKMRPQISISSLFAFTYKAAKVEAGQVATSMDMNPWLVYSPMKEYQRLGFLSNDDSAANDPNAITWRLLKNPKCRFSQTYPQLMVVPSCMTEEQLVHSARFRSRGRLPIVVWRHPDNKCVLARSSQPNYGLQSKRCEADRILLKSYRDSANKNSGGVAPPLHIVDARKNLATQGNRFKGKGVENSSHYDSAVVEFLGIANIHKMRDSIELLQNLVQPSVSDDGHKGFHSNLHETRWLKHIMKILAGGCRIAQILHDEGASVLVHCSDGWDRTPQLCGIAQLILDPYYRTIRGFACLLEKEWCSFGHKFHDRVGVGKDAADMPNERSPVMLQFIDCVWQMTHQFPTGFEFNEKFLLHIVDSLFSGLYGTFLYNSEQERLKVHIWEKTESVWAPVLENPATYTNPQFQRTSRVLFPRANLKRVVLWEGLYFRWDPEMHPAYVESLDPLFKTQDAHQGSAITSAALIDEFRLEENHLSLSATHDRADTAVYLSDASSLSENDDDDYPVSRPTMRRKSMQQTHGLRNGSSSQSPHKDDDTQAIKAALNEFASQAADRARERTKANMLRETLAIIPDKSRVKYLEDLLSESVARELQLEAQLNALHGHLGGGAGKRTDDD